MNIDRFTCSVCRLTWEPARVQKVDGSRDDYVRCVECKTVHYHPDPTPGERLAAHRQLRASLQASLKEGEEI